MARHASGADSEGGSKAWFWPALLGVLAAGAVLFYVTSQANGPHAPLVNPATVEKDKAQHDQATALLEQGLNLLEAGKFSEAMALTEQAMALRGDLVVTHMAVAQIALQMRDYSRAEQEFQVVLRKQPGDPEATLSLAVIAAARKDYEGARKKIAAVVSKADPKKVMQSIPLLILQAAANMDQPEAAARHAKGALQLGRGGEVLTEARVYGPDVMVFLAEQLEQMNRPADAGTVYAVAAKETAGNLAKAQRAARAAELFLRAGRLEAAAAQARAAIEADPSNPRWVLLQESVSAATSRPAAGSQPSVNVTPFGLPAN
jgi:tetratricopeptide (TPR) repeat protein